MAETPTAGPQMPAIDPKNLVDTAVAVIKNPTEFFKGIRHETGLQKPLIFSVAMGVVSGIITAVTILLWALVHGAVGVAIVGAVMAVISGLIGGALAPFIGGILIWVISMIFGSKAQWQASIPIAAYSYAIMPVGALGGFIPVLGILVSLAAWAYGIYICVMGAKVINFEAPPAAATPVA